MKRRLLPALVLVIVVWLSIATSSAQIAVVSVSPDNLSTNSTIPGIELTMSVNIDVGTIDNEVILVYNEIGERIDGTITLQSGNKLTFSPTNPIRKGDMITVLLVKDSNLRGTLGELPNTDYQIEIESYSAWSGPNFGIRDLVQFSGNVGSDHVEVADMDGDDDYDLISANSDGELVWYENDGSNNFTKHLIDDSDTDYERFRTADLDHDGDLDFVDYHFTDDALVWYKNNGSNSFTKNTILSTAGSTYLIRVVDLDGDGNFDITAASNDKLSYFENDGSQNFSKTDLPDAVGVQSYDISDINNDGDLDFIVTQYNSNTFSLVNNGDETFTGNFITITQAGASSNVHIHDFDNDGDGDFVYRAFGDIVVFENTGSSFTSSQVLDGSSILFLRGVNGQGLPDIVTSSSVFKNTSSFSFLEQELNRNINGYPIDFDGDGDLDLIGNGSNGNDISLYQNANTPGFATIDPIEILTPTSVKVSWTPNSSIDGEFDATDYVVLHTWEEDGPMEEEISVADTELVFEELIPGISHFFKVNSISLAGESGYPGFSNSISLPKGDQTITFDPIPDKFVNDINFQLTATSDVGLPVTYFLDSGPATITGDMVTLSGATGIVSITAAVGESTNYNAAVSVTQTFNVLKLPQTITFNPIDDVVFQTGLSITLEGISDSNLPITYAIDGADAAITENVASINEAGAYTISASQSGDESYEVATIVEQSFCANPPTPTITFSDAGTSELSLSSSSATGNLWSLDGVLLEETEQSITVNKAGIYTVQVSLNGCESALSEEISIIVTDLYLKTIEPISIYPNPVNEKVYVQLDQKWSGLDVEYSIMNSTGGLVHFGNQKVLSPMSMELDVSKLNPGYYIIRIAADNSEAVYKIQKR